MISYVNHVNIFLYILVHLYDHEVTLFMPELGGGGLRIGITQIHGHLLIKLCT